MEGCIGALSVDRRLVTVLHEVLDVTHLVMDGLQRLGGPHRAHLDSGINEIVPFKENAQRFSLLNWCGPR